MRHTVDSIRALWKSILDQSYRRPFERAGDGNGLEIFSQMFVQFARVADAVYTTFGSLYLLQSSDQLAPPAGGPAHATVDLTIARGNRNHRSLVFSSGALVEAIDVDASPTGAVAYPSTRRYALAARVAIPPGSSPPRVVRAAATRPGYGYNNPLPGTISSVVQAGVQLSGDEATVALGGGGAAPIYVEIRTPNRADMPVPEHVGSYFLMLSGSNAGLAARVVSYFPPDLARPFAVAGSSVRLAIDVSIDVAAVGSILPGDRLSVPGWLGVCLSVDGSRLVIESRDGSPSALAVGAVLTLADGSTTTVEFLADCPIWVPETGTAEWRVLDWVSDWGVSVSNESEPTGGRAGMLDLLARERGDLTRAIGEDDEHFRERIANVADVVSPAAIVRAVARVLGDDPFCFEEAGFGALRGVYADADDFFDATGLVVAFALFITPDASYEPGTPIVLERASDGFAYARGTVGQWLTGPDRLLLITRGEKRFPGFDVTSLRMRVDRPGGAVLGSTISAVADSTASIPGRCLLSTVDFRGYFEICRQETVISDGIAYFDGVAYLDGSPLDVSSVQDSATNASVYAACSAARAGGVGFSLCNDPTCTEG
jgi:hypothetical protein